MKTFEETFVIIHIRISDVKFGKISGRSIFTIILIALLSICILMLLVAYNNRSVTDIISSFLFMGFVLFMTLNWISAWPKANRMLNKAINPENPKEEEKKETKNEDKTSFYN
jgi:type IV secretory pathway TrbL component